MKILFLLLTLSISTFVSANTITYDNFGRGTDGSKCKDISLDGLIECSGGNIVGTVRYRPLSGLNRYRGDDGSTCKVNGIGRLVCDRKSQVSKNYNSDPNKGNVGAKNAYDSGALLAEGLIGIFEALAGSSNNNQEYVSSSKPRLFDKGTTVQFSEPPHFYLVSSSNGFSCDQDYLKQTCSKGSHRVTFTECEKNTMCGSDGTKNYVNFNSKNKAVSTSFGTICSANWDRNLFKCR